MSAAGPSQDAPAASRPVSAARGRVVDDIAGLRRVLAQHRTIAVVGLSANWYRPSYFAAKYMLDHGYRVIPVNPAYEEVLGQRCYPSIAAIPGPVDIVEPGPLRLGPRRARLGRSLPVLVVVVPAAGHRCVAVHQVAESLALPPVEVLHRQAASTVGPRREVVVVAQELVRANDGDAEVVQERGKVDCVDILGRQNVEFFTKVRAGVGHPFAVRFEPGIPFAQQGDHQHGRFNRQLLAFRIVVGVACRHG